MVMINNIRPNHRRRPGAPAGNQNAAGRRTPESTIRLSANLPITVKGRLEVLAHARSLPLTIWITRMIQEAPFLRMATHGGTLAHKDRVRAPIMPPLDEWPSETQGYQAIPGEIVFKHLQALDKHARVVELCRRDKQAPTHGRQHPPGWFVAVAGKPYLFHCHDDKPRAEGFFLQAIKDGAKRADMSDILDGGDPLDDLLAVDDS